MGKFSINGRIFEFPITGVGRFCYETIMEMDSLFNKGECELLISKKARNIPQLKNIEVKLIGNRDGIVWEQFDLPVYLFKNKRIGINMSNSAPIVKPDYVTIHDIQLKVFKNKTGNISERLRIVWPLLNYRVQTIFSRHIFTVSQFQKKEIMNAYNVRSERISVVYNGWQHMTRISCDNSVFKELGLEPKSYYFAVSTRAKNKNFGWILRNARYNPEETYVIAGKVDSKFLQDTFDYTVLPNIITTGYISDARLKSLMQNAKAFIYPSIYEGFGIPPLEAMCLGTDSIVAAASCLPEIYGKSVVYIDPYNPQVCLEDILEDKKMEKCDILKKYSWKTTAKTIYDRVMNDSIEL